MTPQALPQDLSSLQKEILPLAKTFDLIAEHIIITDADANIVYANDTAVENSKYSREEIIGKRPSDLWGGRMDKRFYADMWHTIKVEKSPFVGEVKSVRKDGTEYWQELKIFPVLGPDGEPRFFIAIEPDITKRKQLEAGRDKHMRDIEVLNETMVDRELRIAGLKKEIAKLKGDGSAPKE